MSILGNPITLGSSGGSVSQDSSGNIIIPPAQSQVEMISFKYFLSDGSNLQFQCPPEFTWQDFIGSEYDTYGDFDVNSSNIVWDASEGGNILYFPRAQYGFSVFSNAIIINDYSYYGWYYE